MSRQKKSLVVGIGNPTRGDDGFGPAMVERLRSEKSFDATETLVTHQLLPEHADMLRQYDRVIFIDACVDLPTGEWRLAKIEASTSLSMNTHHLEPPSLLGLAGALFEATPEAWCLRVGVEQFGANQRLSPKVTMAIVRCFPQLMALAYFHGEAAHA